MGQQANITVFDGAGTPVSHTLVGESVSRLPDGTIEAVWKESLAGLPDYAQIRVTTQKRKLPSGVTRTSVRVSIPVMEAINAQNSSGYTAAPKVAYVDQVDLVDWAHERSTVTGRRLARQMLLNLGGGIATTVTPVTTGPAPELIDQLIQVS